MFVLSKPPTKEQPYAVYLVAAYPCNHLTDQLTTASAAGGQPQQFVSRLRYRPGSAQSPRRPVRLGGDPRYGSGGHPIQSLVGSRHRGMGQQAASPLVAVAGLPERGHPTPVDHSTRFRETGPERSLHRAGTPFWRIHLYRT